MMGQEKRETIVDHGQRFHRDSPGHFRPTVDHFDRTSWGKAELCCKPVIALSPLWKSGMQLSILFSSTRTSVHRLICGSLIRNFLTFTSLSLF